jgi:hypothetical protein
MNRPPKGPVKVNKRTKIVGFSREEVAAARASMQEQSTGTPKQVLDAFFPERITAHNLTLQPCTASTILALQKIESSFTRSDDPKSFPTEDIARCLFIFLVPIAEVRRLLGGSLFRNGARAFPEFDRAVETMCDRLDPDALVEFGPLLNAHIADAFSTAVPYRAKGTGADFPQAPASGPASAGS